MDTFPVVKFGNNTQETGPNAGDKDLESRGPHDPNSKAMEMAEWEVMDTPSPAGPSSPTSFQFEHQVAEQAPVNVENVQAPARRASNLRHPLPRGAAPSEVAGVTGKPSAGDHDVVPAAIGRETCPICIVDFEEGDDLRVLPCEGQHRFHQECVDPWLLELSSSCPICRQGTLCDIVQAHLICTFFI